MKQKKKEEFEIHRNFTYQPCFQENASLFSRIFFIWSHEIIKRGNQKHLDMEDLSDLKQSEDPRSDYVGFEKIFYLMAGEKSTRLMKAFMKYFGITFLIAGLLAALSNLLQFAGPLMINRILNYLNSDTQPMSNGIIYVSILISCYLLRTIIFGHSMHFVNLCCTKVSNSANSLLYHKILNLSSASRKYLQTGSIMTHLNVDIMSFFYFIMMSSFVFSAPCMIIAAIVLLFIEVGWIGFIAPLFFMVGMFIQNKITNKAQMLRKDQLFWTDKRTKCVNQYFSGIRIIKYYGWQKLVSDKIEQIRTQQIKLSFKNLMYRTYIEVVMNMLPIFTSIVIFGVYSSINGEDSITPAKVYTVLSIFNLISTPMRLLVMTVVNYINAKASLTRVDHFFGYEEKSDEGFNTQDQQLQTGDIVFKNCAFEWEKESVKEHFQKGKKLSSADKKPKDQKKQIQKPKKQNEKSEKKKERRKRVTNQVNGQKKKKKKLKKKSLLSSQSLNKPLLSNSSLNDSIILSKGIQINNLNIHRGQFISVIGRVGSGKTTFIYSILGEIDKVRGTLSRRGKIAYIPQVSWLRSATIRENILFQNQYDQVRYNKILKICELTTDLEILGGGDLTQIGQKGVNLSGGQKQRISIARALYSDADIYLIDDCLSALDPYVGKNIFFNALKQFLHEKGKTIVFVTNAIHFTQHTDRVIVLDNGKIIDDDIPEELKKKNNAVFQNLALQQKKSQQAEEEKKNQVQRKKNQQKVKKDQELNLKIDEQEVTQDSKKQKQVSALVKVEQRMKGSVPWSYYIRFFTGPGTLTSLSMFIFILLAQMSRVFSDWWLGQWGSNALNLHANTYIEVYAGISIIVGILIYLKGRFFAQFIVATSRIIQRQLIQALLKTPLSWFDVTPTGRIIARATKDQDDLDSSLAFNVQFSAQNLLILFSSIIIISIATPLYLIVAVISAFVYSKLIGLYINSSREIKRLEANSRAPLINHISETINGTYVIRAFNKQDRFINRFFERQKAYIVAMVNQNICNRWINIITDLFSIATIAATGYFGVLSKQFSFGASNSNLIGLALVWSLQINGIMSFTLRILADTESNMNSVVRLYEYIDNNPSEKSFEEKSPSQDIWPTEGKYNIEEASYRYRPQLPLVLKNLSFDVKSKQKIGVVGRTGSGKSTLTLGLLRILELTENENKSTGLIELDGQDTSELGLHILRHNVTIIPQDPVLFTGNLKTNIDPFNKYTDEQIAECLKKVSLWDQIREEASEVSEIRKKVYCKVDDSGSNFSLGQRQLICMARALIRQPKVLLMDEATASIDEKTDDLIQNMIRTEFKNTTVITIAHRLNTIIYYDKILVLQRGEIKQYDQPLKLVKDENSFLGKLIRKTGEGYMKKIIALAEKKMYKSD